MHDGSKRPRVHSGALIESYVDKSNTYELRGFCTARAMATIVSAALAIDWLRAM